MLLLVRNYFLFTLSKDGRTTVEHMVMPRVHLTLTHTSRRVASCSFFTITRLTLFLLLIPSVFAISLSDLPTVPSLDAGSTAACQTVYTQAIPDCSADDFQGDTCSTNCIGSLASVISLFRQACDLTDKPALSKWEIFKTGASVKYICDNGGAAPAGQTAAPPAVQTSAPPGVPAVPPAGAGASLATALTTLVVSATVVLSVTPPPPPPVPPQTVTEQAQTQTITQAQTVTAAQTLVSVVTSVSVETQPTETKSITQTIQITTTAAAPAPPPATMTTEDPALMSTMASYMSAMSSMGLTTMTATPQPTATNDPAMSSYMSSM